MQLYGLYANSLHGFCPKCNSWINFSMNLDLLGRSNIRRKKLNSHQNFGNFLCSEGILYDVPTALRFFWIPGLFGRFPEFFLVQVMVKPVFHHFICSCSVAFEERFFLTSEITQGPLIFFEMLLRSSLHLHPFKSYSKNSARR